LKAITIKITSFIDDGQPGWVECKFTDAWNKEHIVHDKVPIVSLEDLNATSKYPRDGLIACEIIKKWKDEDGRIIFTVTTEKPWAVYTIEDLTEFDVLDEQLIEFNQGQI
jgi:hypothetical protein